MVEELILSLLFRLLPLARKWIYSEGKFKHDIVLDTRSSNSISFSLNTEIPVARIWLKITNKSQYLDAVFDRAVLLSVRVHGKDGIREVMHYEPIISRTNIEKKKDVKIFCEFNLNEKQIECLRKVEVGSGLSANLQLEYYIDSLLYHFSEKITLENRPCELNR